MSIVRLFGFVGVLLIGAGCQSTQSSLEQAYIEEFLTSKQTALTRRGWRPAEYVVPDADLLLGLRESSPAGAQVVAVAFWYTGIHPRWTMVFLERGSDINVVATYANWGTVTRKVASSVPRATFSDQLSQLEEQETCVVGSAPEVGFPPGITFAYWGGSSLYVCDSSGIYETSLPALLQKVLDDGSRTYWEFDSDDI